MTDDVTPQVVLEAETERGWRRIGSVSVDEPPGSFVSYLSGEREVFVFGWWEGQRGLWRSIGGADTENTAIRALASLGLELLSDLAAPHQLAVTTRPNGAVITIRFSAT